MADSDSLHYLSFKAYVAVLFFLLSFVFALVERKNEGQAELMALSFCVSFVLWARKAVLFLLFVCRLGVRPNDIQLKIEVPLFIAFAAIDMHEQPYATIN